MQQLTKRSIASFVIKMLGVYVMISSLPLLPGMAQFSVAMLRGRESLGDLLAVLGLLGGALTCFVLFLCLGVFVIKKSDSVAERILPEDETIGVMPQVSFENVAKMIIIAMGLLLTVKSLPLCLRSLYAYFYPLIASGGPVRRVVASVFFNLTEMAAGLIFVFRPGWVYSLLFVPHVNTKAPMDLDDEPAEETPSEDR